MKKLFITYFALALLVITSCKRDKDIGPASAATADVSKGINASTTAGPIVPLLVAGKAGSKGWADGTGAAARFDGPSDICVGTDGTLYLIDYYNEAIRKITTQNKVTTLKINPELFGSPDLLEYPDNIAVLNDGTVGITSYPYIVLYKNDVVKQLSATNVATNQPGSPRFSGLDKDPTGSFFYYSIQNIQSFLGSDSTIVDSYLGTVRNNALSSKLQLLIHQSYSAHVKACPNGYRYFISSSNIDKSLTFNTITATGTATRIFKNLNLGNITTFVVNKTGTEIYYIDYQEAPGDVGTGAIIKRIKNNVITTILTGARPSSLALANSEKFLYYTSNDNTVNRIPLP